MKFLRVLGLNLLMITKHKEDTSGESDTAIKKRKKGVNQGTRDIK